MREYAKVDHIGGETGVVSALATPGGALYFFCKLFVSGAPCRLRIGRYIGLMKLSLPALLVTAATLTAAPLYAQTAPAAPDPMPSFASLFRELPADFQHLVSPQAVVILGIGGGVSAAVHPNDVRFTRDATTTHALEESLDSGQYLGDGFVQAGGAFATYFVGRMSHNTRVATIGAELVRAQIVAGALTEGLKLSVNRTRPNGQSLSFPSGHSSASFATAAVLQRELGWKVGTVAYAFASYVAVSRLSENKHYASDVAFGAAIGILAGRSITMTVHHGTHDLTLAPIAAPGGGGVGVNWTKAR